jgi:SAM-dependent methyltransferase
MAAAAAQQETGYPRDESDPRKRLAPSCARNKQPILEVLLAEMPPPPLAGDEEGDAVAAAAAAGLRVLEVASGTGEHCAHFVGGMPHVAHWQPTEFSGCAGPHLGAHQDLRDICESITAFTESLPNVAAPRELNASAAVWAAAGESGDEGSSPEPWDVLLACNVTHISPEGVTRGIVNAAVRLLRPGGKLLIYGPFAERSQELSEGNANFDTTLRARGEGWALREVEWVDELAGASGAGGLLRPLARHRMPANNLTLVYEKLAGPPGAAGDGDDGAVAERL